MANHKTYDVGDLVQVSCLFKNLAAVLTDPTTTTITIKKPTTGEGASVIPDANPSVGSFTHDITITNEPGVWFYRFKGTGAIVAAVEGSFSVRTSNFASP